MSTDIKRREFLQLTAAATAFGLAGPNLVTLAAGPGPATTKLVSPGCRRSKVKVARLYMGIPGRTGPPRNWISRKRSARTSPRLTP